MTLRLSVVSEHGMRLGTRSTKVFGVHGGSIGRGADNEWILPDPERYLSGKHARIDFRAGAYVLVDTSSNGTYVNGAHVALGKYHDYSLQDGDYVRLGEYELLVSIDESNDFPPEEGATVAYDGAAPSSAAGKATADDLGADLDLCQLLEPGNPPTVAPGLPQHGAYGHAVAERTPADPAGTRTAAAESRPPWHMTTRPLKVAGGSGTGVLPADAGDGRLSARAAGAARIFDGASLAPTAPAAAAAHRSRDPAAADDIDPGLAAFCRGAGLDPRSIMADTRGTAPLQIAGQLLREAISGLMDLNHGRDEFRNRFRIDARSHDGPESPLNFSRGVEEALVRLMTNLSARAGSVDAVRENFKELKATNTASLAAMRCALEEFLLRVDPQELAERFEQVAKRGVFGSQNKGRYWDLYAEMFASLTQRTADGFPHVFAEAFAKGYATKLSTLIAPRRGTFGALKGDPDGIAAGSI